MKLYLKRRSGGIAIAIILLFIAQWIAAPFHFAEETHAYCSRHNQYEHSGGHHAVEQKNADENVKNSFGDAFEKNAGVDGESEHEACNTLAIAKNNSGADLKNNEKTSNDFPAFYAKRFTGDIYAAIKGEILLIAPKNSPPVV